MKGIKYPIKEALIDLVINRQKGKNAFAQFTCDVCENRCTISREGESKSMLRCCRCSEINYLTEYEIIIT